MVSGLCPHSLPCLLRRAGKGWTSSGLCVLQLALFLSTSKHGEPYEVICCFLTSPHSELFQSSVWSPSLCLSIAGESHFRFAYIISTMRPPQTLAPLFLDSHGSLQLRKMNSSFSRMHRALITLLVTFNCQFARA